MDKGNAGLLLQFIHILRNTALGLANIDDHVRRSGQQRLKVQLTFSAIKLAQNWQIVVFLIQKLRSAFVPRIGDTHQLIRCHGEYHDLGQRAGNGNFFHIRRYCDLAAAGVREYPRGAICGGVLAVVTGILRRLCTAGKQRERHRQCQQQRHPSFSIH